MSRDGERDRLDPALVSELAGGLWLSKQRRNTAVGQGFAGGYRTKLVPDSALTPGASDVERKDGAGRLAPEETHYLRGWTGERRVGAMKLDGYATLYMDKLRALKGVYRGLAYED